MEKKTAHNSILIDPNCPTGDCGTTTWRPAAFNRLLSDRPALPEGIEKAMDANPDEFSDEKEFKPSELERSIAKHEKLVLSPYMSSSAFVASVKKGRNQKYLGVRPCDLSVTLPLDAICSLRSVKLEVTLVTFNGYFETVTATTERGSGDPYLPTAFSVGASHLDIPMEMNGDQKIEFEVATGVPKYLETCFEICPASRPDLGLARVDIDPNTGAKTVKSEEQA